LAEEIRVRNADLRRVKEESAAQLAAEDKRILEEILQEVKANEEKESHRKQDAKDGRIAHMKFVESQMNVAAESETALDRLWQEENDKEWAKREQQWSDEQSRRDTLLKDVFATRRAQIDEIRTKEHQTAQAKHREHENMVSNIHTLAHNDKSEVESKKRSAKTNQDFVLGQIRDKEQRKEDQVQTRKTELTDAQAEESMYQQKLVAELSKLDEAKPSTLSHLSLKPKRQHGLF